MQRAPHCLLLLAYAGLLCFYGLGDRDLTSSHEARAGQNAQTILRDGDWLLPRLFDRHLELQKPPLYYWLVALIAALASQNNQRLGDMVGGTYVVDKDYTGAISGAQPAFAGPPPSGTPISAPPPPAQQQDQSGQPPNWYPDPHGQARLRYWDGQRWTEHTSA